MRVLITICFLLSALSLKAQSRMNSSEVGYVYDLEHEFLIDHRVAGNGSSQKVFLKFTLNSGNVKVSDFLISYDLRSNYTSEKSIQKAIELDSNNIIYTGFREFIYQFEIEDNIDRDLVVVDIYNIPKNRRNKYDVPLKIGDQRPPSFLIFEEELNIPYFNSYINKGDKIRIKDVFSESGTFEITGFQNNAELPMPPFDDTERKEPAKVSLDTLYGAQHNEIFTFYNEGYYKITRSDDSQNSAHILVADPYYPYFDNYNKLIRPLIFLSTNTEYEAILASEDTRDGFEEFVQNTISSNERVAKDFVKYYFRRIRKSAKLFSEDREGWKTDRGMIYLVFGDPLQVFRNEQTELWVYSSGSGGRLRFVFDKIEKDGMIKHQLIRGDRYKEDWMTAVTQWRAGRIIE